MLTATQQTHAIFLQKVKEQYERIKDALASGFAEDHAHYLKQVGIIQGLALALELMDEASSITNGDDRGTR